MALPQAVSEEAACSCMALKATSLNPCSSGKVAGPVFEIPAIHEGVSWLG